MAEGLQIGELPQKENLTGNELIPFQQGSSNGSMSTATLKKYIGTGGGTGGSTDYMNYITEYNVSVQHPTSGIDGSNKYSLEGAIVQVPQELRNIGLKVSFINSAGKVETWEFQGGTFTNIGSWVQGGVRKVSELEESSNSTKDLAYSIQRSLQDIEFKDDEEFVICDSLGNVIFTANKNGIKSINMAKNIEEIVQKEESELVITDSVGHVIARISKDGIDSPNIRQLNPNQTWMSGKNIFVLGDSLSSAGIWMKKLAEITGAVFDQDINSGTSQLNIGKPISYGGTQSYGYNSNNSNGTQRAKNLVEISKRIPVDVLFIQNVNDGNSIGSCFTEDEYVYKVQHERAFSEAPNFPKECVMNDMSFITRDKAIEDFKSNVLARIGGTSRSHGMMYMYKYSANSAILKITGKAAINGTINIIVNSKTYGCTVTTDMELSEICDKVIEWDFTEYSDTKGKDNTVTFVDLKNNNPQVEFDANGTGVTATVEHSTSSGNDFLVYSEYNYTDEIFANGKNWKEWYELGTMYSKYKGLLEYLQQNLPDTKIFFVLSPNIAANFDSLPSDKTYPDGSMNINKLDAKVQRALREVQADCAKLYGIPVLNVAEEWGISYLNAYPKYYSNNNVHPNDAGYERWGETMARLLCGK